MHEIDFLPAEFRRGRVQRHQQIWHLVAGSAMLALLVAAALAQWGQVRHLRWVRSELEPHYQTVLARREDLARLEVERQQVEAQANLVAYLGHPWPMTRILAALADPLPEEISLHQVRVARREAPAATRRPPAGDAAVGGNAAAAADLARFRREIDSRPLMIEIAGSAKDGQVLHSYIRRLGEDDLFTAVELHSMEAHTEGTTATLRFTAGVQIRPGYGQTGGPNTPGPGEAIASVSR